MPTLIYNFVYMLRHRRKCILKNGADSISDHCVIYIIDDVKSNIIQTNVKGITVKLIHFSIAGLIVKSLKLSDLGKREAQNQLTIDKTWANNTSEISC